MNVPLGRVTRLWYKDTQPKLTTDASVLVVEFRAPNAEIYEHELDNRHWLVDNPALQLMALYDFKPSDIEGTLMDVEDWRWTLPLTYVDNSGPFESTDGGEYKLSQMALKGGEAALRQATWFDADDGEKLDSEASAASEGGGSSDPSGGADKTAEDSADETAVTVEVADEEEDSGIIVDATE